MKCVNPDWVPSGQGMFSREAGTALGWMGKHMGSGPSLRTSIPDLADGPVPQRIDLDDLHRRGVPHLIQHLGPGIGVLQSVRMQTLRPDVGMIEEVLLHDDVLRPVLVPLLCRFLSLHLTETWSCTSPWRSWRNPRCRSHWMWRCRPPPVPRPSCQRTGRKPSTTFR